MSKFSAAAIQQLSRRLHVESEFLVECLEESVIEIRQKGDRLELNNGTALRLRRLQRLCDTFNVELSAALLIRGLCDRIEELERQARLRKTRQATSKDAAYQNLKRSRTEMRLR